nr:uncharacterized protein CI109_005451 [Kwoniella shandongensis]KAA5526173.1 hypothetical protein CI109_005451 [Kwoniella shandongensis]
MTTDNGTSTPTDPDQPIASTSYILPTKHILSKAHLAAFQRSKTHAEIVQFIDDLNEAIVGKNLTDAGEGSERTKPIIDILNSVLDIAKSTPPVDNKLSRFGNPAFKTFYDKVGEASAELHSRIPSLPVEAIPEVEVYFKESWGNKQRVDYGSGMEFNFLCWLLCLNKLGVFTKDDYSFLVLGVFWRYIEVMRYLQSTYWLEPAGSHGVWGLDDYHFLPFLWGSGQLRDDISAVKSWNKVNEGMKKMYIAEVLGKLPVMQHALFGSKGLLPFPTGEDDPELKKVLEEEGEAMGEEDEHGHVHLKGETGWTMDCCGIPVPSAFAAAKADTGAHKDVLPGFTTRSGIKPIPFD